MAKDGKVEVICPVDERTNVGGNKVPTIPDYVLAHLFKQLSDKLGDNIVRDLLWVKIFLLTAVNRQ